MDDPGSEKYVRMTTAPIEGLVVSLAGPSIAIMLNGLLGVLYARCETMAS